MIRKTTRSGLAARRGLIAGALLGSIALASAPFAQNSLAARTAARPAVKATINVGTKNFPEEYLVSDMYKMLLERHGFHVGKTHNLATTDVLQKALLRGQIDMYPEYTGTGQEVVLKRKGLANEAKEYKSVKSGYQKKFHLTWLKDAPMNDTNSVGVTAATAQKYGLRSLSDLAKVAGQLTFAGYPDCKDRADCLGGLEGVYGIHFKNIVYADSASIIYKGVSSGTYDVIEVFTTDGPIKALNLRVLKDNKGIFPADHIAPVVRTSILRKYPQIAMILNPLAKYLTTGAVQKMNVKVVLNSADPMVVARAFLKSKHLL
jgi:glycine betaine/choline ABC-type transport system substrate-binding protein